MPDFNPESVTLTVKGVAMTDQQCFDRVTAHLLSQGSRCRGINGMRYQANHLACAIGCLITDDAYSETIEGQDIDSAFEKDGSWSSHVLARALRLSGVPESHLLLTSLQTVHDMRPVHTWREELVSVADFFGLNKDVFRRIDERKRDVT